MSKSAIIAIGAWGVVVAGVAWGLLKPFIDRRRYSERLIPLPQHGLTAHVITQKTNIVRARTLRHAQEQRRLAELERAYNTPDAPDMWEQEWARQQAEVMGWAAEIALEIQALPEVDHE